MSRQDILQALNTAVQKMPEAQLLTVYEPVITVDSHGWWWSHVLVDGKLAYINRHMSESAAKAAARDFINMCLYRHAGGKE